MIFINKIINFFNSFKYYSKELGPINGFKTVLIEKKRKDSVSLKLKGYANPILIRANTSDLSVFEQIFMKKDYDIPIDFEPQLIIDGGAYVGYSSVYFSRRFPYSKIVALEPAKANYEILVKNISNYNNISSYYAGLWSKRTSLLVKDEGFGEWGFLVEETEDNDGTNVPGYSVEEIINSSGFNSVDILKLDIEGSEVELFSNNYESWLSSVKVLIIELHDRIKPECSDVFFKAIKPYNFSCKTYGENIILINNNHMLDKN